MENQDKSDFVQRLKAIIETAIDGIITIDHRGIVETINPSAAILFGYKEEEVLGNNINMLMPQPYRKEHDGYIHNYQKTKNPRIIGIGREVHGRTKSGRVFPMRLAVSEVILNNRVIYTGIIHDLSEVKKAQQEIENLNSELESKVELRTKELENAVLQLLKTNEKLYEEAKKRKSLTQKLQDSEKELIKSLEKEKELNELKSRFVSMASHEFRTPLTTIMSSASLITKYPDADQQENRLKHVDRIKSAVVNLTGILNDFLSLNKLEQGGVGVNISSVNIEDFMKEVVDEIKGLLKNGQEIKYSIEGVNKTINSDKRILKNILFNLVSNAIKYSKSDIICNFKVDPSDLTIMISDTGIGIPEDEQKHLFTRFFRASNVINYQGTGLGLNIVKRYLSLLNGTISFESKEDEGTTFVVKLPVN